jgi:ankyrin repeat protein
MEVDCLSRLDKRTPLHQACAKGHVQVARALLTAGAEVDRPDHYNWTPLLMAARRGHTEIAMLLLEKGANPNVRNQNSRYGASGTFSDPGGKTPMEVAALWGKTDTFNAIKSFVEDRSR